jgi:hypothetical protein
MSTWYYYNEKGEKITVTGGQLKGLAKAGIITAETVVETEDGKTVPARKVKGLTFVTAVQSPMPPSAEPNPFSAVPPAFNPSAVTVSPVEQTIPQNTPVSFIEKIKRLRWYHWIAIVVVLGIIGAIADKSEKNEKNGSQPKQNNVAAPADKKQAVPNSGIALKALPEREVFQNDIMNVVSELGLSSSEKTILEILIGRHWLMAKKVSQVGELFDRMTLLMKMSELQSCFDDCAGNISTAWSEGIHNDLYPDFNTMLALVGTLDARSTCRHNLGQMMLSVESSVRKLNKTKYKDTIELYVILSSYKEAVNNPSGTYMSYTANIRSYREEFTRTMSRAKLEW